MHVNSSSIRWLIILAFHLLFWSHAVGAALPLVTEKRFYRAYGDVYQQTQANTALAAVSDAYCDSVSSLSNRDDARQCRIGLVIFDPCFVNTDKPSQQLKCIQTPWSTEYRLLNNLAVLTEISKKKLDMSKDLPWGIELLSGERCLRTTDNLLFQGQPIRYHCQNQEELFGYIQHCKEPWSMLLKKRNGKVSTVVLGRVWF